ncbi:MAG: hypothetical protein ACK55I_19240 [bacterium]|jgi:hypothetical protein
MRKVIANKGGRPKLLTGRTVKRIARAVNAYERGDRDAPGQKFPKAIGGGSDRVRVGKVEEPWEYGQLANVTLWEGGEFPNETESSPAETLEDVANRLSFVPAGRFVLVAQAETGTWYLVGGDIPAIRLGKTTADWDKNTTAEIQLYDAGDFQTESSSGSLAGCVNKYHDVGTDKWVHVARAGNGKWYLIAAEC